MDPDITANMIKIDRIIKEIKENMEKPGIRPVTSEDLRKRAKARRSMRTAIKIFNGGVNKDYADEL